MITICICGGGNLGHVTAALLASQPETYRVNILTGRPDEWQNDIEAELPDGSLCSGTVNIITGNAEKAVAEADIVLLCLPGFMIRKAINSIMPHVKDQTAVGSIVASTGFFFQAMQIIGERKCPLFAFQRVPFIARTVTYGKRARLLGDKKELKLCVEQCDNKEQLRKTLETMFNTPTTLLNNYYEASLTNSNSLLHPARLYSLWSDYEIGDTYEQIPLFYEDWDIKASELYIAMDNEFQQLLDVLPIEKGSIPTVLDYYESHDAASLTAKLRSIKAFKGIKAPMKETAKGFIPDIKSRYFKEDFPYGLRIIRSLAHDENISTPTIDMVDDWENKLYEMMKLQILGN